MRRTPLNVVQEPAALPTGVPERMLVTMIVIEKKSQPPHISSSLFQRTTTKSLSLTLAWTPRRPGTFLAQVRPPGHPLETKKTKQNINRNSRSNCSCSRPLSTTKTAHIGGDSSGSRGNTAAALKESNSSQQKFSAPLVRLEPPCPCRIRTASE